MNRIISTQLRPYVVGIALCAATVASAQIQYPDAPADAPFKPQSAAHESLLPETKTLLLQNASRLNAEDAANQPGVQNAFGTDPLLTVAITGLLPCFATNTAQAILGRSVAQREAFDAEALGGAVALTNPFAGNFERFRSAMSFLEAAGR